MFNGFNKVAPGWRITLATSESRTILSIKSKVGQLPIVAMSRSFHADRPASANSYAMVEFESLKA